MTLTIEIALLALGIGGLLWVFWVYYLEAKRCYTEDMKAQRKTLSAQGGTKDETKTSERS